MRLKRERERGTEYNWNYGEKGIIDLASPKIMSHVRQLLSESQT